MPKLGGGYYNKPSIFDQIKEDDIILAFFPCIRFDSEIILSIKGVGSSIKKWSKIRQLENAMRINNEINEMYQLVSMLAHIAYKRNLKLIIENPANGAHYLKRYWPIEPALIDWDRSRRGDNFKKPTQYWFINCKPKYNFEWGQQTDIFKPLLKVHNCNTVERSMITSSYAENFIKEFIL